MDDLPRASRGSRPPLPEVLRSFGYGSLGLAQQIVRNRPDGRGRRVIRLGAEQAGLGHPAAQLKQVLLYLPVVHAGHEALFTRHADAAEVLILGTGFRDRFKSLAKDIRALPPERAAQFLRVMLPGTPVRVMEPADLPAAVTAETLVLPDEDITRNLAAEHHLGDGRELVFDQTFLRWDRE